MVVWTRVASVLMAAAIGTSAWAEEESNPEQQFLFFLEEGYLQEEGEWEVGLSFLYQEGLSEDDMDLSEWTIAAEVEYGLTEWLQLEVELPWKSIEEVEGGVKERENGIGDAEVAFGFLLMEEEQDGWKPTVSVAIEASLPTGDWKEGLGTDTVGYGPKLGISKTVEDWVFHVGGGLEWINGAKELEGTDVEKSDIFEINGGAAAVYQGIEDLEMILEFFGEYEAEEPEEGDNEYETELYLTPGLRYEVVEGVEFGGGIPVGLNDDSYDWGVFLKLLCEW